MTHKEIIFYRKISGECPVKDFMDSLPDKVARKIGWVLDLAESLERVPAHYFCKLADTDNIWEFRIKLGSNIYRVFAFMDGHQIVVTNAFVKKTQKIPVREIQEAQNYKRDYFSRRN